jgi:uncharacterized phiE125 gp8 family phage protein
MDKRYKIKTPPTFSPVSIAELKRNLHIEHNDQDELMQELITRAVAGSQMRTGRQYALATYTLYLDSYPDNNELEIELGPVNAITSVKYLAPGASLLTTVDPLKYQLDNIELTARLRFLESFTPDSERMNVIEIEFTTGWATAGAIPKDLCEAMILTASDAYLHPENQSLNFGMGLRIQVAERKERNYKVQRY